MIMAFTRTHFRAGTPKKRILNEIGWNGKLTAIKVKCNTCLKIHFRNKNALVASTWKVSRE